VLLNVNDPTFSRQRLTDGGKGCQPYTPAALYSPETIFLCFWYSFLLEAEKTQGQERLSKIKISRHRVSNLPVWILVP
jgi:hypothetical protein